MPLNIIEEKKFKDFHKTCQGLGVVPPPSIFITTEVRKIDDETLLHRDTNRGHSWVRNFYNNLFAGVANVGGDGTNNYEAGKLTIRTVGGDIYSSASHGAPFGYSGNKTTLGYMYTAGVTDSTFGIVVGESGTVFNYDDYKLASQIIHGYAQGQLFHHGVIYRQTVYDPGDNVWSVQFRRIFDNLSYYDIEVREIGLYRKCTTTTTEYNPFGAPTPAILMMERSLIPDDPEHSPAGVITIPDGSNLTVTYEIKMDFSTIDE